MSKWFLLKPSGICQYLPEIIQKLGFKNFEELENQELYVTFSYILMRQVLEEQVVAMKIVFLIGWKFAQARELSTFLWQLVLHHVINAKLKKEGILTIVTFRTNTIVECSSETKKLINKGEEVEITERIRKQVFVW